MGLLEKDNSKLLDMLEAEALLNAEASLSHYVVQTWEVLEPHNPYLHNWHIELIAEHLESVLSGHIKRLIINLPPRYLKSNLVSVALPTWSWVKNPSLRWIFASYSHSLSTKHSVDRRNLITSPFYQRAWGNRFQLASDQNVKTEFTNTKRGHMIATSTGGTATGKGADIIVVDDPHSPLEAMSDVQRKHGIDFFDQTLSTRLDNKKEGAIIVVMQRLHQFDLTNHLLEQGGWEHLSLPAVAEEKTKLIFPLSGRELERNEGDILFPNREGEKEIETQKKAFGSFAFAAQYQQKPLPVEGNLIKRAWFKSYKILPQKFDEQILSADLSFKNTATSDYCCLQIWGRVGAEKYLLDQVKARMDFPTTINAFKALLSKWPKVNAKLIEDTANGPALIAALKQEIPGIIPIQPKESKIIRVANILPQLEAGNVYLPDSTVAPWIENFIAECCTFPKGHDDAVDAMTQALVRLDNRSRTFDIDLSINDRLRRVSPWR